MTLPRIKTERELVALAIALEQRAARRFKDLSSRMAALGRSDLAGLFEGLAGEEEDHARVLLGLPVATGLDPEAPERAAKAHLPDPTDQERVDSPDRDSVYACLANAVKNEQKAFEFFSYVAASAEDERVQRLAEDLAQEELGHAKFLRRLRRQAYHRQRPLESPWPKAAEIQTLQDLRNAALRGEALLASHVAGLTASDDALERVFMPVAALSSPLEDRASSSRPSRRVDGREAADDGPLQPDRTEVQAALDHAQKAFAFYDAVVSAASREDVMLAAQALSDRALERIKALRRLTD